MAILTRVGSIIERRLIGGNRITVALANTSSALLDAAVNTTVLASTITSDVLSPINVDNYNAVKLYTKGSAIALLCEMKEITLEEYRLVRDEYAAMSVVDRDLYVESLGFSNTQSFFKFMMEVEKA